MNIEGQLHCNIVFARPRRELLPSVGLPDPRPRYRLYSHLSAFIFRLKEGGAEQHKAVLQALYSRQRLIVRRVLNLI